MRGSAEFRDPKVEVGSRTARTPAWDGRLIEPSTLSAKVLQLQRSAGNLAVARLLQHVSTPVARRGVAPGPVGRPTLQRQINAQIQATALADQSLATATHRSTLDEIVQATGKLTTAITTYNQHDQAKETDEAKESLREIVDLIQTIDGELLWLLKGLRKTGEVTDVDNASYVALARFKVQFFALVRAVNTEVARIFGVTRADPGGRPDVSQSGIEATFRNVAVLKLSKPDVTFVTEFAKKQGGGKSGKAGTWKEQREGLTAIWAKRAGKFKTLEAGKSSNLDVEYVTSDRDKPVKLWDQKSIVWGEQGFEGRLEHTHTKGEGKGVDQIGLLLDSTFVSRTNYERAWLLLSNLLLNEKLAPAALAEVHAPNPEHFISDIFVDAENARKDNDPENIETNVAWAETLVDGQQDGLAAIPYDRLANTNLRDVLAGTQVSYSRYVNDRDWLPENEIYNEFPVKGVVPNPGKARFVVTEGPQATRRVYFSVTHYDAFTVKKKGGTLISRNAFYRVRVA